MLQSPSLLPSLQLEAQVEHWPIAGEFTISRGRKTQASVIVATLYDGHILGRGECVPYARYGETLDSVQEQIFSVTNDFAAGISPHILHDLMPAGAARNAVDCALWDYFAKSSGRPAHSLAGVSHPIPKLSAYTLSLDTPEAMAAKALEAEAKGFTLVKVKLGGAGDDERMRAIRKAVPKVRLILDANEAWDTDNLQAFVKVADDISAELIEQPLPEGNDACLKDIDHLVPICADESTHTRQGLTDLVGRYDAVNIKLDKTGGLSEALNMIKATRALDLKIMVGCMVGTSLAMAPATLLAQFAHWVDLDGPLLLEKDRQPALKYDGSVIHPPLPELWG